MNAIASIEGVGDLLGKTMCDEVTGESAIKPEYTGNSTLILESTYRHILLVNL